MINFTINISIIGGADCFRDNKGWGVKFPDHELDQVSPIFAKNSSTVSVIVEACNNHHLVQLLERVRLN